MTKENHSTTTETKQDDNFQPSLPKSVKISTLIFLPVWLGLLLLYNGDWPTGIIGVGLIMLIELTYFWGHGMEVKWYAPTYCIGLMATGVAKLVWPEFPWLTNWMAFGLIAGLLVMFYFTVIRLYPRARMSAIETTTMKFVLVTLLLFFLPVSPKYNVEKVVDVYDSIKDDVLIFRDYTILRRGSGIIIFDSNGDRVPNFERAKSDTGYKYSLADRQSIFAKSIEYYMNHGFPDEDSFMVHFSTMLDIFEGYDLFHVRGNKRRDIPGLITIMVTYNDILYFYPDSLMIPNEFYEYALKRGELQKLDANWFYVKRNDPM